MLAESPLQCDCTLRFNIKLHYMPEGQFPYNKAHIKADLLTEIQNDVTIKVFAYTHRR